MPDNPSVAALNDDEDSFFGCTFPLTYGVGGEGFFPRSTTLKEQASSNIKNLLLTMKGERLAHPEFGSDLPAIIFEPIDGTIGEKIDNAIREALAIWLPYITAENILATEIKGKFHLTDPAELRLAVKLLQFSETINAVIEDYQANILCNYLFELAGIFMSFYEACPVLKASEPHRTSRLLLCHLTASTLQKGLDLLGIETIEQM